VKGVALRQSFDIFMEPTLEASMAALLKCIGVTDPSPQIIKAFAQSLVRQPRLRPTKPER